jgi:8-oxo-dGTP pyrophosphatase MutT (NUDIX family)
MSSRIAVMALVQRDDGRLLFIRRAEGIAAAGYWTPVGGKVEPGESLEHAVARETLEEVGLVVSVGPEVFRCPSSGGDWTLIWFDCRVSDGANPDELTLLTTEVAEARWVSAEAALKLDPMFEDTRGLLQTRRDARL